MLRRTAMVVGAGLLTFALVVVLTQQPQSVPAPTAQPVERTEDSLAARIPANQVAIGVPVSGWEALLRSTRVGDRLNVIATLPTPIDGRPATAVVVNGARVLQPATAESPLLLEVPTADAMVLAHLVLGGTPLAFAVWAADGSPPAAEALDEDGVRAQLGLAPRALATPIPVATRALEPTSVPTSAPSPTPVVVPEVMLPDTYVVQPGQSLSSIAAELGVDEGALWWANRYLVDPGYVLAGMELSVPRFRGFRYQVRPGDSWFTLSRRFGLTPEYLRQRNELPQDAPLVAGTQLFVPLSP